MKNPLMKCARKLIYQTSFSEMQDILLDYQDFLTQDKNYEEPISNEKSLVSYLYLFTPWILLIFYAVFMYFITRNNYISYNLKLLVIPLFGISITQLLFCLYNKKSLLLSKYQKNTSVHNFIVCASLFFGLTSVFWIPLYEKNINLETLEIVLILLLFWSLHNYMQTSHLYFYSLLSIFASSTVFYQYRVLRSMFHFEDFQNNFVYIIIYLCIHLCILILDLIIIRKYKKGLVLV